MMQASRITCKKVRLIKAQFKPITISCQQKSSGGDMGGEFSIGPCTFHV